MTEQACIGVAVRALCFVSLLFLAVSHVLLTCSHLLVFCFGDAVTRFNMSRKWKALTLKETLDILSKVDKNPQKECVNLACELGLPVAMLNTIVGKQEEIQKKTQVFSVGVKHTRGAQHGKMEQVLVAWFKEVRAAGVNVDGTVACEKADEIALFLGIDKKQVLCQVCTVCNILDPVLDNCDFQIIRFYFKACENRINDIPLYINSRRNIYIAKYKRRAFFCTWCEKFGQGLKAAKGKRNSV